MFSLFWKEIWISFGPSGIAALAASFAAALYSLVNWRVSATLILFAVFFLITIFVAFPAYRRAWLRSHGERASAIVRQAELIGWNIQQGSNVLRRGVRLVLEIRPPGRQPFQVTTTIYALVVTLSQLQPGREVDVFFDPDHPMRVLLDERF